MIASFRRRPSSQTVVRAALASLVGLLLIVPSGALVRLTDSGLGCPDWPGCHGEVIPPMSGHAWIEYTNRIFSAVVVIVAVVAWVVAIRSAGAPRRLRRAAAVPALAGLAQGPLGGLTVVFDLHPALVASHFLLSMVALAAGVVFVLLARDYRDGAATTVDRPRAGLAAAAIVALAGVIVTGVLVTASGPHSGDPAVIDRIWNLGDAAAVHVRVVIAFTLVAAVLAVWLIRNRPRDPVTRRLALAAPPLLAAQIAIGEYQYRTQLPWEVILVHVTVAATLWACCVGLAWQVARPRRAPQPEPPVAIQPVEPASVTARQASST